MMNAMAATDGPSEGGHPPPPSPFPEPHDTAAASSQLASAPLPASLPPRPATLPLGPRQTHDQTLDQTDAFPELPPLPKPLPSPRTGRSKSLAIKRKPLSSTASPAAVRYSNPRDYADVIADLPRPEQRFARSCSLDSPTLYEFPDHRALLATSSLNTVDWPASPDTSLPSSPVTQQPVGPGIPADGAEDVHSRDIAGNNPAATPTPTPPALTEDESLSAETASLTTQDSDPYELGDLYSVPDSPESQGKRTTVINTNTTTMSMISRKSPPPHLKLGTTDGNVRAERSSLDQSNLNKPLPKSPASSKLSTFFGWAASPSPSTETDYSDKGFSPIPSLSSHRAATVVTETYETPLTEKSPAFSNATENPLDYCEEYLQTPSHSTASLDELDEMEDELKAISAELASSIRREMDLDDLVERLQEQINNPQAPGKRTSDYFSDSGYSSAKFSDYDQAREEMAQVRRRAEQEKAQIRLELTNKLQDERSRRRILDQQIQQLSQRASQMDTAQLQDSDASDRVKELESTCENLSRRLSEEREAKNNIQDLFEALKGELSMALNERDNLRDEIVPQLRARVEGLEAEAAEHNKLAYDTTKLQQELQALRVENAERAKVAQDASKIEQELEVLRSENAEHTKLVSVTSKMEHELQLLRSENAELKQSGTRMSMALSRSASVTGGAFRKSRDVVRPLSISRSNTTRQSEPREALAERLKDVEAQRDALHNALKNLLERQEFQNRENAKRIRQLEMERDRLLTASPKKAGYEREVSKLRDEISMLRRRAEEAIEQKWQVEKGLGGLKMDLDRAEEEIASLRSLLKEKEILVPESLANGSDAEHDTPVTSASLEKAFQELQAAYIEALRRIQTLEESAVSDEKTQLAIQRLEQALAAADADRDLARTEAASYRAQFEALQDLEKQHLDTERDLADQLHESAQRVEALAQQVRAQLKANAALRTRLADTIARGEAEQRVSTGRIAGMQARLRTLEEQVVAAQTSAEERVTRHEEELAHLREAHSSQLQRLRDASGTLRSAGGLRLFPPKSPLSPMFINSAKSPRMSTPAALAAHSARPSIRRSTTEPIDMTAQVDTLKARVAELEGALASADAEMQEVVGRMGTAQIEVLTLQEQREEAVRETRRLQALLQEETMKVFEQRFRSLGTIVA